VNRSHLPTVIAVAVVAYAADDMIHEVLGHGLTALFVHGVKIVSVSTVALQTAGASRLVAANGTIANLLAGLIALGFLRRGTDLTAARYFLWLFGAVNLMNGMGYFLFSGLFGIGDWAVVIAGLQPPLAWRLGMSVIGLAGYIAVVYLAARAMHRLLGNSSNHSEVRRLVVPAYIAGGLLLVIAAALNPISPKLILLSGASVGFGAMAGLLFVPNIVEQHIAAAGGEIRSLPMNRRWLLLGLIVGGAFIAVLGRGIHFSTG
jgi:hypothetical protein